ncbi:MAG TPA: D-alanyl-D-alanine carboxypeptidase family protein, partial [Thermoleophilaceae bacterium]|nr:D-alanyl-D-alanine carboxypeptidase family protein [Thermoleophilaceae bacterium]
ARLAVGLLLAVLVALPAGAVAAPAEAPKPPKVRAPAAIVVDADTGVVLYEKHPDRRRSIASTTKLMTALLTLREAKPGQVLSAAPYAAGAAESTLGLEAGERMTVHDLLRALLLPSANDAAATLARGIAGSEDEFVTRMNAEARALGLGGTSYANPVGLDDPANYSTARDLATLARHLLRDRTFAGIVDLPRARLRSGAHPRTVLNRNTLVGERPFVDGVKTGHTQQAGYVLVGAAHRGGAKVVSVVLGEPSEAARDSETLELLRYGLKRYTSVHVISAVRALDLVPVSYFDGAKVTLHAARDVRLTVPVGARIHTYVRMPFPVHLVGPKPGGATVGEITVAVDGHPAARVPLVTGQEVPSSSFVRRLAIEAGHTRPTLALGIIGVALLALLQFGGPLVGFRGVRR